MGISSALGSSALAPSGFGFRNLLINGDMQIAQRGTSTAGITSSTFGSSDRWRLSPLTMGTWTQSTENDGPTGSGFRKSAKVLCTTADASPASSDHVVFVTSLEGQNIQQFAKGTSSAKQFSLSFWVKSNVTGTYIANLYDNDNTRWCSSSYTIFASATWEKKTITLPADTTGEFDNDNNNSLVLHMFLGAGTSYTSGTLGTTWRSAAFVNSDIAVGQVNLAAATNNYWQITGVQLEANPTASTFEHRPIGVELALCQRYYWREQVGVHGQTGATYILDNFIGAACDQSTWIRYPIRCPVPMRGQPTLVYSNTASNFTNLVASGGQTGTTLSGLTCSFYAVNFYVYSPGVSTGAAACLRMNNANAYLGAEAEL